MMNYKSSKKILSEWLNEKETTKYVSKQGTERDSGLPITDKSFLGAVTLDYSLITALNEKIRLFGGDDLCRSSIKTINKVVRGKETAFPGLLVIADDVYGGIYAINNGFEENVNKGNIVFLPANSFEFEDLEIGYASFVYWCLSLSEEEWINGGWKTSDMNMSDLRRTDEYITAKLYVVGDLKRG